MDKKIIYAKYIEELLREHAKPIPIGDWDEYENQVIIDKDNVHFQLMRVGWWDQRRTHHCTLHIDLKDDGKIWIQEDLTEIGIANQLIEKGVPESDIVLAFYAPFRRENVEVVVA